MNLSIVGYGKMGKEIERIALLKGIKIISTIDPTDKKATHREISAHSMKNVDVCIEFTNPDSVIENIKKISSFGKNLVVGTTGWQDKTKEVEQIVRKSKIGLIYASNFSIGVNAFFRIIDNASRIMNKIEDYDVYGYEMHHSKKLDSPSGTAKSIEKIITSNIKRKKSVDFASVRSGSIPGIHVIGFDSSADTIELKHEAKNREGFASGAVMAAGWINKKKGFYEINEMMKDIIGEDI